MGQSGAWSRETDRATPHPTEPEVGLDNAAPAWEATLPMAPVAPALLKKKRILPEMPGERAHLTLSETPLHLTTMRALLPPALLLAVCAAAAAAQATGGRNSTTFVMPA